MKELKKRFRVSLVLVLMISLFSFTLYQSEETIILGTWIPQDLTLEEKWVFTSDGVLKRYSDNVLYKTYNWSILTTSPACGEFVPVGPNYSNLRLVNINNINDIFCYDITSLDNDTLQIRYFGTSGFLSYVRP